MRGESIIGIEGKQRTTLRVRLVAFVAAITLLGWANSVSVPVVSADSPCVDGWQQMPVAAPMTGSGAAASIDDQPAWWVGGSSAGKPQVMRWDGTEWQLVAVPLKQAGSLKAVSAVSSTLAWTVGYRHPLGPRPISARWDGTSWKSVFVPNPGGQTTLGSVAALPDGTAWAVGASLQQGQLHPVALAFNGTAWINKSPSVAVGEESGLLAVTNTAGGIWTAGWRSTQGSSAPWIASWNGSSWTTASLPDVGAQGIVTSLAFSSALDGWAAGYLQLSTGAYAPLLMHYDGVSWTLAPTPWDTDSSVLLTTVSVAADGTLIVAGNQMGNVGPQMVIGTLTAGTWQATTAPNDPFPGSWISESAPTATGGWVVGARTTLAQNAFGAAYISCVGSTSVKPPKAVQPTGFRDDTSQAAVDGTDGMTVPPPSRPTVLSPRATVDPSTLGIDVEDKTGSSGLALTLRAFSGLVADFNGDSWQDIFLNQHTSGSPLLEMGGPSGFTAANTNLHVGDFFDCSAADVNNDSAPDLFCPTGRRRGTFLGVDEFRLDVGDTGGTVATRDYGLLDASGRGRASTFVHLAGDAYPDLFVTTWPMRMDGYPSLNRFYRNPDGTHFAPDPSAGLDVSLGGTCATAADLNGDGNDEVLFCSLQQDNGLLRGARVYSYNGTTFVDKTGIDGIYPIGDLKIDVADFNGDGRPDIAQLSRTRIRVSLQNTSGHFNDAFDLTLKAAVSMGVGDVNGDGRADIYIRANTSQLMLVNNGGGKSFTSITLPPTKSGSASEVLTLDYDNNGLTDFLSLNGEYKPGKLQLIAFFPYVAP